MMTGDIPGGAPDFRAKRTATKDRSYDHENLDAAAFDRVCMTCGFHECECEPLRGAHFEMIIIDDVMSSESAEKVREAAQAGEIQWEPERLNITRPCLHCHTQTGFLEGAVMICKKCEPRYAKWSRGNPFCPDCTVPNGALVFMHALPKVSDNDLYKCSSCKQQWSAWSYGGLPRRWPFS